MPCWSLFDAQNAAYRESVFPTGTPVLSVEALGSLGWEKVRGFCIL
jgi:transketolase